MRVECSDALLPEVVKWISTLSVKASPFWFLTLRSHIYFPFRREFCFQTCILRPHMYFEFRHVFCVQTCIFRSDMYFALRCILGLDIYFRVTHTSFAFKCVFCVQTCILRSDMYFAFTQCICVQTCILRCPYFSLIFPRFFRNPSSVL